MRMMRMRGMDRKDIGTFIEVGSTSIQSDILVDIPQLSSRNLDLGFDIDEHVLPSSPYPSICNLPGLDLTQMPS